VPTARLPDDVALTYLEWDAGDPPLLLIAGIPAVADDWAPLAERLTGRRVIAYDNRGSGGSTVTPGPYTTAQLADDAAALLDHLGIARADVFGMSMGGMIAQEVALLAPERVRHLVLGCTHAGLRHATRQPRETAMAFAFDTDEWEARIRALAPHAFSRHVDRDALDEFIAKKAGDVQDPAGYRAQVAAVLSHDALDRLPRVSAPPLVITGDDDRVIPGESSEPLAKAIPGARLHIIDRAGHLFFIERPGATLRGLRDFLG